MATVVPTRVFLPLAATMMTAAILLAAVGCAQGTPVPPAGGTPQSASGVTGPAGSGPGSASTSGTGCPTNLAVTEADSGRLGLCVAIGGTVTVTLHGPPAQAWEPIQAHGDALVIRPGSSPSTVDIAEPVTIAAFTAAHTGTTELTSSRAACPPPSPGSAGCHARQAFNVTIRVP